MRTGCDAVRLRRGGYYPPGCFPMGKTTSAHCADNAISNICRWNLTVQCRNMVYMQHWNLDTAKLVLPKNLQRWRADDIHPYTVCATEISARSFGGTVCVGAAISRPVVFPMGKQRRRIAPTMQYPPIILYRHHSTNCDMEHSDFVLQFVKRYGILFLVLPVPR